MKSRTLIMITATIITCAAIVLTSGLSLLHGWAFESTPDEAPATNDENVNVENNDATVDEIVDEEISIGDYVLTGGEIPACILVDCVARMIDGVLAAPDCYENESIASGLLEYPQYTRPYEFHGKKVPDVLLSGHHANIAKWRYEESLRITKEKRPDLLKDK